MVTARIRIHKPSYYKSKIQSKISIRSYSESDLLEIENHHPVANPVDRELVHKPCFQKRG